ncbi:MAG: hypothetical protein ACT4OO_11645 [Nitrospiraceae bacterium]
MHSPLRASRESHLLSRYILDEEPQNDRRDDRLKNLDAIHLAPALTFHRDSGLAIPFVTADTNRREAAEALAVHVIWVS